MGESQTEDKKSKHLTKRKEEGIIETSLYLVTLSPLSGAPALITVTDPQSVLFGHLD
jgi:hypothetical protein